MGILDRLFGGHQGGGHHGGAHHGDRHGYGGGYGSGGPPASGGGNAGVACPNCKALNALGARFFQQCGTTLVPSACTQCGTTLQAWAKFCAHCGKAAT